MLVKKWFSQQKHEKWYISFFHHENTFRELRRKSFAFNYVTAVTASNGNLKLYERTYYLFV